MHQRSNRRASIRAQGLVEFALVAPLFFLLLFGLIEGARLVYAYNTVNHAAQEAARVGVLADTSSINVVRDEAVSSAQPLTVYSGDVSVEVNSGSKSFSDRDIGDRLFVSVDYDFVPIVLLVFGSNTPIQVSGSTELMIE